MAKQRDSIATLIDLKKQHWPAQDHLNESLVLHIHRLSEYLKQDLYTIITDYQLQEADFSVLTTLHRLGKPYTASPTVLYNTMLFSSGGLTKVLMRLEQKDAIVRIDNPEDKRSKLVQMTDVGFQTIEQIMLRLDEKRQQSLATLALKEKQQLEKLLQKFITDWE